VLLAPWEYLFLPFNPHNFPDLYTPMWVASLILLTALVILYNVRTRALHRHAVYLDLWEWLLWSGLALYGLLITAAVFSFEFIVLLVILAIGMGAMLWIRFLRFPPILSAYEVRLAKQRYYTKTKFSRPETTIRPKTARRSKRRR
jgi:Na+/citrate or Na+/malate symporter